MEQSMPEAAPIFAGVFGCFMILIYLAIAAVSIWAFCKIFAKAGYSWALGLLMLVPIANFVMILYLGFSDWPITKNLRQLQQQPSGPPQEQA